MANKEHLTILKQGVETWNKWRENNPGVMPDISGADLRDAVLNGVDLSGADIRGTIFKGANLEEANCRNVKTGLQKKSFLIIFVGSFLFSSLFGTLALMPGSLFFPALLNILPIMPNQRFNYVHIFISFGFYMILTAIMVMALRRYIFYYVSVAIVGVVAVIGAVCGTLNESLTLATSVALTLASTLVLASVGAGGLTGSGTGVLRFGGGTGAIGILAFIILMNEPVLSDIEIALNVAVNTVCMLLLAFYIAWKLLKEEGKQFSSIRKVSMFIASFGRTNFEFSNLKSADFTDSALKNSRFDKTTNLSNTCWKNAQKLELSQLTGTIIEIPTVRDLLTTFDGKDKSFNGLNLRGAYLKGANLQNADFRNTDLRNSDLSGAKITGIKLFGTSREDWIIEGVECDYVFLDEEGTERYPKDRNFAPGEFEELYSNIAAINENLIERFIEFPPEYHQAGISILNYFGSVLKKKYPDTKAKIKIEQDDLKVKMIIDPVDGGDREIIEQTLDDYGLVITGQMPPEEFTSDRLLLIELRSELRMAQARVETQKELLQDKSAQIDKLLSIVGQAVQSQPNININQEQKTSGGKMSEKSGDTISITSGRDTVFAKDQAIATINKTITESANLPESMEDRLKELTAAVEAMVKDMPDDKAKEITGDLQTLVDEAAKDEPRKKWYELSADGLIEAAKTVGTIGQPVIDTTQAVLKLLAP